MIDFIEDYIHPKVGQVRAYIFPGLLHRVLSVTGSNTQRSKLRGRMLLTMTLLRADRLAFTLIIEESNQPTCAFHPSVNRENWEVEIGEKLECLCRNHVTREEDLTTVLQTEVSPDFLVNESICQRPTDWHRTPTD